MLLLAAACFVLQSTGGDVAAWIGKLASAKAADRAAAQLFLARNLSDGDLDLLRKAAEAGDAETRRRLALAIADDDAKISLAVALAAGSGAGAIEVGRGALEERLARWCPGWTRPGLARSETATRLGSKPARPIRLDPRTADRRLDVALDQLVRIAPGALPIVLDPDLALSDHPRETSTAIEAPFARALLEVVRLHRAELEGFAIGPEEDADGRADSRPDTGSDARPDGGTAAGEPVRPWIRVRRAVAASSRTGSEWIADWCVGSVADPSPARRAACARAVASTGWPGGIAWLERRAFAGKDDAALEGVLLAAGRGQPAPSLNRPEILRDLLSRLHAEPARVDMIVRAIAAAGPIGPKAEDLAAIVAEDLVRLPPREAWLRLAALEGMRSTSRAALSAIDAVLAGAETPPPLRFQAMRARAATDPGSRPARVEAPEAVLLWAASAGLDKECARLLVALGVPPPARLPDGKLASFRLADFEWSLFASGGGSNGAGAASRLLALVADEGAGGIGVEALAERTRALVRRGAGPRLARAVAAARALPGADGARLDRLEMLSGAGDDAQRARWTAELANAPASRTDLLALGALAAGPGGDAARDAILRVLASGVRVDDTVDAATLALDGLWSALKDETALEFSRAVGEVAANGPKELRTRLRSSSWPTRRGPEPVNADELDRTVERSGL